MQITQRSLNQTRSLWTLIGLALRIAQGCGLHRDGEGLQFNPLEAEMRRAAFGGKLYVSLRTSEDRGSEAVDRKSVV